MNKGTFLTLFMTVALCIFCIGPAQSQSSKKNEYADFIERALVEYNAGYNAGRWDEARILFERAHEIDPNARTLRGMSKSCPPEYKSKQERGAGLQVALLGTGVAAAATGLALMLVSGDEHERSTTIEVSLGCGLSSCYGLLSSRY